MSMVGFVDWGKVEVREEKGSGKSGAGSIFLNFGPGKYKIRCLGQPYFFLQTFISKKITGADKDIAVISPGADEDPLIKLNIEPQQKGAINVLHRDDGNKLKVMRFGSAIYKHIRNYAVETGIDPADIKKGIDFVITVSDPGGNMRNRQYVVTALNNTPITKEEASKIKADGGLHDVEKLFAPTPLEKINEYIEQYDLVEKCSSTSGAGTGFDDDDDKPAVAQKTAAKSTKAPAKAPAKDADEADEDADGEVDDDYTF